MHREEARQTDPGSYSLDEVKEKTEDSRHNRGVLIAKCAPDLVVKMCDRCGLEAMESL